MGIHQSEQRLRIFLEIHSFSEFTLAGLDKTFAYSTVKIRTVNLKLTNDMGCVWGGRMQKRSLQLVKINICFAQFCRNAASNLNNVAFVLDYKDAPSFIICISAKFTCCACWKNIPQIYFVWIYSLNLFTKFSFFLFHTVFPWINSVHY